jgi:hypothetical protein
LRWRRRSRAPSTTRRSGPASLAQFAGALFSKMTGVELTAVPYRSATQAMVDVNEGASKCRFGAIARAAVRPRRQGAPARGHQQQAVSTRFRGATLSESGLPATRRCSG